MKPDVGPSLASIFAVYCVLDVRLGTSSDSYRVRCELDDPEVEAVSVSRTKLASTSFEREEFEREFVDYGGHAIPNVVRTLARITRDGPKGRRYRV